MNEFFKLVEQAKKCLEDCRYDESMTYIKAAMLLDISAPEPHNLYGIILESSGDRLQALKHYRAATDLDPTYIPAKNNLYREAVSAPSAQSLDM